MNLFGQGNQGAGITILNGGATASNKGVLGGSSAKRLMSAGWDPNALRTNASLLYDEWKLFDRQVQQIAREKLTVVNELSRRGLTYPIPNALGVIQLVWQTSGDMNPAEVTMTGLPEADKDGIEFGIASMPLPMIHKEFQLDLRQLEVSRRMGMPLDAAQAEIATRKVAEMVESIIFTGLTIAPNLGAIYGLLNHPNRITGSVTHNWGLTGTPGSEIVYDALRMITALNAKNMFGPYLFFVPTATYIRLSEDYRANGDKTILDRLMDIPGVEGIMPTNRLTGSTVLAVQMTSDVIQLVDGIRPTMVEWDERGGFELNFMIFCILLPRVRVDYALQSGIAHYS